MLLVCLRLRPIPCVQQYAIGYPSLSYPWIGLVEVGVGVVVGVDVIGEHSGGVVLLFPMVAHKRSNLLVSCCISLMLFVGCISCNGCRLVSIVICSCCLMIVSFSCRSAFAVFSLNPVEADVCLRTFVSSLLKKILK